MRVNGSGGYLLYIDRPYEQEAMNGVDDNCDGVAVSYTHLRAHETVLDLVCRLLLEKKNKTTDTEHDNPSFETTHRSHIVARACIQSEILNLSY